MMERGQFTPPDSTIAMGALAMASLIETLCHGAPLHGKVIVVVERSHLVDRPRERAMVVDLSRVVTCPNGISAVIDVLFLSTSDPYEPDNDIVGIGCNGEIAQRYAWIGSRLPSNSGVGTDF